MGSGFMQCTSLKASSDSAQIQCTRAKCMVCRRRAFAPTVPLHIFFFLFSHTHTPPTLVHSIGIIYDFQLQVWVSDFQAGIRELVLKFSFQFSSLLKHTAGLMCIESPSKVSYLLSHLAKLRPRF